MATAHVTRLAQDEQMLTLAELLGHKFALVVQPQRHAKRNRESLQCLENFLLCSAHRAP